MILLPFHIIGALLAVASGAIAMYSAKGARSHRRSGMVFVVGMLVMASTGATMAAWEQDNWGNVVGGVLTLYLVGTGLLTVRRPVEQMRGVLTGLMLVVLIASALDFRFGFEALHNSDGMLYKIPAPPYFLFAIVGLLAGLLDARVLLAGGIQGAHRLARHLWRMTFAMWIATASLFLGKANHFPEPIRKSGLLPIPVLLVIAFMIYWLVRVLRKRRSIAAIHAR